MKPGSKDIKVFLKFTEEELSILQDNTWQMAESFGLDRRIGNLTGKRKVGFFLWDLECLEMVVDDIQQQQNIDKNTKEGLYDKIKQALDYIQNSKKV
jgi:hypothetical protein